MYFHLAFRGAKSFVAKQDISPPRKSPQLVESHSIDGRMHLPGYSIQTIELAVVDNNRISQGRYSYSAAAPSATDG